MLVRSLPIHYVTRPDLVTVVCAIKDHTHLVTVVPVLISDELLDPPNVSITREDIPVTMVMGTKYHCNFNRYGC